MKIKHFFVAIFIIVSFYRKTFSDKIIVKANIDTQTDFYSFKSKEDTSTFKIRSNNDFRLFLSLDYEFIGVSIGFAPDFISNNKDDFLKGESSFTDYKFRFFLGNWVQGLQYSKIKGFYVENTNDYLEEWKKGVDPYIQFSNLTATTWGMSTSYIFNPKFSYRNIVYQTEWQKKSAGSLIPTLFYDYNKLSFNAENTSSIEHFFNIRLALSYYYTLVLHENWFFSSSVSPAVGIRFSKDININDAIKTTTNDNYFSQFLDGGIQLGYSSDKIIFGCNFNFNINSYKEDSKTIVMENKYYGLLYIGYRFNAPKIKF